MATIDLKLKTYEQLQFEVNRLVVDNFLKQQELDQYKNNWEELKKWVKKVAEIYNNVDVKTLLMVLDKMKELEEKNGKN